MARKKTKRKDRLLNAGQVAERLGGVGETTLNRLHNEGRLLRVNPDGTTLARWHESAVAEYVAKARPAAGRRPAARPAARPAVANKTAAAAELTKVAAANAGTAARSLAKSVSDAAAEQEYAGYLHKVAAGGGHGGRAAADVLATREADAAGLVTRADWHAHAAKNTGSNGGRQWPLPL